MNDEPETIYTDVKQIPKVEPIKMDKRYWLFRFTEMIEYLTTFDISVKRSKFTSLGWTIDPSIRFNSRNRIAIIKMVGQILRYFKIDYSSQDDNKIIVNRMLQIDKLIQVLGEALIYYPKIIDKHQSEAITTFSRIVEMYREGLHTEKEGFYKILELRKEFMPRAMTKQQLIEKHFGGSV